MTRATVVIFTESSFAFWCFPEDQLTMLRQRFPDVTFHLVRTEAQLLRVLPQADVYLGWQFRPEWLPHAPRLRWIHSPAAGVRRLIFPEMQRSPIVITNARGVHATVIAEHVIGAMILVYRKFLQCFIHQRQRYWGNHALIADPPGLLELAGRTVLIYGYGTIGQAIGRRAHALDMTVWAVRRHPDRSSPYAHRVGRLEDSLDWLSDADFVVVCMPYTDETREWFDRSRFERMRPTAVFINVARGHLVREPDLLEALQQKRIRAAVLDVFQEEPLPPDSPFWTCDNVLITPHVAGVATDRHWHRVIEQFAQNLERFLTNRPLLNVVDKQLGY